MTTITGGANNNFLTENVYSVRLHVVVALRLQGRKAQSLRCSEARSIDDSGYEFPRRPPLGISVNRGNLLYSSRRKLFCWIIHRASIRKLVCKKYYICTIASSPPSR